MFTLFNKTDNKKGFTLIELLVVITIIAILSSIAVTSTRVARGAAQDSTRLRDMQTLQQALEIYRINNNGEYPDELSSDPDSSGFGWEDSHEDPYDPDNPSADFFLKPLVEQGLLPQAIEDPVNDSTFSYRYFRYAGVSDPDCPNFPDGDNNWCCPDQYYVLGIKKFANSDGQHPDSPGVPCASRDWYSPVLFEWVTGGIANPDS